ncbi:MAG: rod shape-determining protein [Clostridiales bacterium]|nr:rod shape-determining protein [Clostridiales bacterium]MDY5348469.1 rod shape-determining protein [Candidatus Ventricola sp.]MDY5513946.1 rod shape-determining protein [Candidatus Ventricola sp.]
MGLFQFVSPDIAVDLGTNNTRVYVKDKGIVVNESSVIITRGDGPRNVIAVGDSADELIGRSAGNIRIVHPLRDGVIVDYELAQTMIHYFVSKAIGTRHFIRPRVVVTMPSEVSKVERRAVINAMEKIGARQIYTVEQAFAAALGTGLPVYEPQGNFIVDIGGGTTEVAVVSMGGIVLSHSIRIAGNKIDEAISGFLKKQHGILVTERVAEQIKLDLPDVRAGRELEHMAVVRGRDIATGMPLTVDVNMSRVSEAIREPIKEILSAIKWVLGRIPPELAADILQNGIFLTGGSAALPSLDSMIATEFGVPVSVARDAGECTTLGAGYMADHFDMLGNIGRADG